MIGKTFSLALSCGRLTLHTIHFRSLFELGLAFSSVKVA